MNYDEIVDLIKRETEISELNMVQRVWEERMKELAAETLKPGSKGIIRGGDLYALDYIWDLHGDYSNSVGEKYHARALDYYVGRKVEHVWGTGILEKVDNLKYGNGYGIKIDYPCFCGNKTYEMYAVPGVHTGGFAYLCCPDSDKALDVRNEGLVCEACKPSIRRANEHD